ncbi:hypothetical protein [Maridesulfovibrio zosterae]|uniref:hypothetical protein n=1 Tax=Maridesulfovibrio zosterae TaxID=82171 RepID=UPI0003F93CC4|nr:hypothetical protein [Maridesulfovibrio zosterae]
MNRITSQILSWMADIKNNAIEPESELPAFGTPLIGFSSAADSLFDFLKVDIGADFYWTPLDAFKVAFPEADVRADELSVIAWVLPQTEHTRASHRRAMDMPSIEWSRARYYGEKVNENLRRHVVKYFADAGLYACAPVLLPQWSRAVSDKYGYASRWSERHAAYVSGLGTFGLSDGLITSVGKAIRVGSVIVHKKYDPTSRAYTEYNEWCLFYAKGKCRGCMQRCPAGAITESGHDKVKCKDYIRNITSAHVEEEQLGVRVNSCGLCQTKVPCESRNPVSKVK